MSSRIVNNLLSCLPGNATAMIGEAVPLVTHVASVAKEVLSGFSYLQIGGAGLLIGAGYLSYRYLAERDGQARALPVDNVNSVAMEALSNSQVEAGLSNAPDSEVSLNQKELDERDVQARALPLMQDDIDETGKACIVKVIRKIPSGEREDVIQRALPLMQDDMTGLNKTRIVNAIRQIPSGERKDVIQRALPLMQGNMDGKGKASILKAIQEIPPEELEDVIKRALPLMRDDMAGDGKASILKAIQEIPPEELEDVIKRALPLMRDDMAGDGKASILKAIRDMPSEKWEDVIQRALPLMRDYMPGDGKAAIINVIRVIPSAERKDVIDWALPLMWNNMNGWHKAEILDTVRILPLAERNARVARALEQLQIDFPNGEFDDGINEYPNRVTELLETPLDQAFLPMGQDNAMAAAAAAGHAEINVHAGQRDARVKAALLLLRKSQKMSAQEIDSSANACVQYLQANGHSQALWVLNGPNSPNDYGPFFKTIVINGESTSGQEVIGRLWGFIHALPESEKQLVLHSLVAELGHCINEHGERICNPGKMQHLFIAILQGRLAGVQVDDSIEIPKIDQGESSSSQGVPVQGAIRVFFATEKHQAINTLESLLLAAHAFCDANPRVDREAFIQELKNYAAASGIQ